MAKIRSTELVGKSETELLLTLDGLKVELANLRVQKAAGSNRRGAKTHEARKNGAHVLTVINQTQKARLREFYSTKKYVPLDLRPKYTRAIRRRVTKAQTNMKTVCQIKQMRANPTCVFAVKA
ncbi:60S ribosomal protein L35 [Tieghemiomyces parasiticus]|uniref:60S ribosomal protein L35 n=1 Tax=Tieghemiomyces parasiticus TaxID=78921 RepID=A0A9W7ZU38_9FUNG|nr:60S ribosomal protein L35 [Tieghemiomyces parasiticus]